MNKEAEMRNLVFVIWMLGYPLVLETVQHLHFLQGSKVTYDNVYMLWYMFHLVVYLSIAKLLYEKKPQHPH
jgi:hypothetical protein